MAKLTHDGQSFEVYCTLRNKTMRQVNTDRPLDSARNSERTLLAEGPSLYYNRIIGFKILPYFLVFYYFFFIDNPLPLPTIFLGRGYINCTYPFSRHFSNKNTIWIKLVTYQLYDCGQTWYSLLHYWNNSIGYSGTGTGTRLSLIVHPPRSLLLRLAFSGR